MAQNEMRPMRGLPQNVRLTEGLGISVRDRLGCAGRWSSLGTVLPAAQITNVRLLLILFSKSAKAHLVPRGEQPVYLGTRHCQHPRKDDGILKDFELADNIQ